MYAALSTWAHTHTLFPTLRDQRVLHFACASRGRLKPTAPKSRNIGTYEKKEAVVAVATILREYHGICVRIYCVLCGGSHCPVLKKLHNLQHNFRLRLTFKMPDLVVLKYYDGLYALWLTS